MTSALLNDFDRLGTPCNDAYNAQALPLFQILSKIDQDEKREHTGNVVILCQRAQFGPVGMSINHAELASSCDEKYRG